MSGKNVLLGDKPEPGPAAQSWVRAGKSVGNGTIVNPFTARLTIDITPQLRGQIKIVAFERGVTVAEMLRQLLEREYSTVQALR
jgi:hypothetical protein